MKKYVAIKPFTTRGKFFNAGDLVPPKECNLLVLKLKERKIVLIDTENPYTSSIALYHLNRLGLNIDDYMDKPKAEEAKEKPKRKTRVKKPKTEVIEHELEL